MGKNQRWRTVANFNGQGRILYFGHGLSKATQFLDCGKAMVELLGGTATITIEKVHGRNQWSAGEATYTEIYRNGELFAVNNHKEKK